MYTLKRLIAQPLSILGVLTLSSLTSLVMLSSKPAYAQKKNTIVIHYDFTDPKRSAMTCIDPNTNKSIEWSPRYSVPAGRLVIFQVQNVNPYFYDVKIEGTLVSPNNDTPPAELTALLGLYTGSPSGAQASISLESQILATEDAIRGVGQFVMLSNRIDGILANYLVLDANKIKTINSRVHKLVESMLLQSPVPGPLPVGGAPGPLPVGGAPGLAKSWEDLSDTYNTTSLKYLKQLDERTSALALAIAKNDKDPLVGRAKEVLKTAQDLLARRTDLEAAVRNGGAKVGRIKQGTYFQASGRVTAGGDAVRFTVSIKPTTGQEKTSGVETVNETFLIPVTGEWRIGFSGGTALTDVGDRSYAAVTPTGGNKTLVLTGSNKTEVYPVFLLHAYRKSEASVFKSRFQPALSIGGTKVGDNPRYMLGASAIFGERAFLSAGVAYGKATRLASGLATDQVVPDDRTTFTSTPFRTGYFISLTFRIGGSSGGVKSPKSTESEKAGEKK